jgi:L-aspartate oxidase
MVERLHLDGVLVIGAGLAGLTAALAAAPRRAMVLSPGPLGEGCASAWAQGGMAAALGEGDEPSLHAADTLAAGAGLCDPAAVDILTGEGPLAVRALAALGAPFDRDATGTFVQSLEAAHSRARVARVGGDGAGLAIMRAVIAAVRAAPHIEVREGVRAVSLLQNAAGAVAGAMVEADGALSEIVSSATVLATGGIGGLYAVTTNPLAAQGEGLALAAMAGAEIADPEFIQFHPTAIALGIDPAPLATEALRGDGARLVDEHGIAFMDRHHPLADLAPRDVVARAIAEQSRLGPVFLDTPTAIGADFARHFPAVDAACRAGGLDPSVQPIPVTPAAHYHMGGVATDSHGRTSLPGLFAVGECASTGVHGANRLASNSLLEAAVFGARAGRSAATARGASGAVVPAIALPSLPAPILAELRVRMSGQAGVTRDAAGLGDLLAWIGRQSRLHGPAAPLIVAGLIAKAALERQESRGAHFRRDFPAAARSAERSLLRLAAPARAQAA